MTTWPWKPSGMSVINGPEHFLGHDATLSRMQKDYVYPDLGDRLTTGGMDQARR